uniref:Uncharacterized protein n=1 Tax=Triticum urartu TaxID=4572 RepID=A0A8R7PF14_TRIUA
MAEEAGAQMKIVWLCRRADDATEVTVTIGHMRSSGGVDLILQGRGVGWCGRQGGWAGASCSGGRGWSMGGSLLQCMHGDEGEQCSSLADPDDPCWRVRFLLRPTVTANGASGFEGDDRRSVTEHVQAHGFMPIHPSRQVLGVW